MQCPESDVLIDVARAPASASEETRQHVEGCLRCRRDVALLQSLREALDARADLPAPWVDEIIARLPDPVPAKARNGDIPAPLAGLVTAFLAASTTLLAAATLSPPQWYGAVSAGGLLGLSLTVGVLAGLADFLRSTPAAG